MTDPDDLAVLWPEHTTDILVAAGDPKTVEELADEAGAPIATAYRRVDELTDAGLLETKGLVSTKGPPATEYYRPFDTLRIDLTDGGNDE